MFKKNCIKSILVITSLMFCQHTLAVIKGVGIHPDETNLTTDEYITILKKYNVESIRFDYRWGKVEKSKDNFTAASNKEDELIKKAKKNNINTLLILDYGNGIYNIKKPDSSEEIQKFANYASWVTEHFKNDVDTYEIWNEWSHPNKGESRTKSIDSAKKYFELVKLTSIAIRKVNPNAVIVAGSFNPIDSKDVLWASMLINLGILNYIDGISIHPYSYMKKNIADPQYALKKINDANNFLSNLSGSGHRIDFYITEVGYPNYDKNISYSDAEIAQYLEKYYRLSEKMTFIKGIWWYQLLDKPNHGQNRENSFGLIDENSKPKLSADVFKSLH